jgi:GPI mannosyltransferase 3
VLLVAAVPRMWAALDDGGAITAQETFLSLEPAHHLAFGPGMMAAAMRDGARSWLFPALIAAVWKAAALVGTRLASSFVSTATVLMAALSLVTVSLSMALARRLAGERAAMLAGLVAAFCPPLVVFGSRALDEVASAPLLLGAVVLLYDPGKRRAALSGVLATLPVFFHYPLVVWPALLAALLAGWRRPEDLKPYAAASGITLLAGGLLDWPMWGAPFHSASRWLATSLSAPPAPGHPAGPLFYWDTMQSAMGLTFGLVLLGLFFVPGRARFLVVLTGLVAVFISILTVKESWFVLPLLALAIALGSVGLARLSAGLGRGLRPTLLLGAACALQMAWTTFHATTTDLGLGGSEASVWHFDEDPLRLEEEAAKTQDLCGLAMSGIDPHRSGGYAHLHRSVPLFFDTRGSQLLSANGVIASVNEHLPPPWRKTTTHGVYALWLRPGECAPPPPGWTTDLP